MLLTRMLAVGALGALLAAPAWGGEAAGEARQPVTVATEIPLRPELQAFQGVRGWLVNGKEITREEAAEKALLYEGPFFLQDMVAALLLHEEAKRRGIGVSEQEVDAQIRELREEMGLRTDQALEYYLRRSRRTHAWLREKAADYVLMQKVLGDQVYVSDKEVERLYTTYREQYRLPEAVTFRAIGVETEQQAKALLVALRSGRSFEEVASEVATPQERASAGQTLTYQRGQVPALPGELEAALFAAPLNQVAGPIRADDRYYLVRVESKRDAYQFSLEEVKDTIRTQRRKQKLEQAVWPNWIRTQLAGAEIEVLKAP